MSKRAAVKIEHIVDLPLDKPGFFLRLERRYWQDGSSCLHIAKWARNGAGKATMYYPLQYVQVPWEMSGELGRQIAISQIEEVLCWISLPH